MPEIFFRPIAARSHDVRTHTPNRTTDTTHASTHHPLTAKWGGAEVTKALLEAGAAVAQSTTLGVQPLHMAAQEGQEATARLLLSHGAPAGATDRAGWSAFPGLRAGHRVVEAGIVDRYHACAFFSVGSHRLI